MTSISTRIALTSLALTAALVGQDPSLTRSGGVLPGAVDFQLQGAPGEPFVVVVALELEQSPLQDLGVTLDISDDFGLASFQMPGLVGTFAMDGTASAQFMLPDIPELVGFPFLFQTVAGVGAPNTFGKSDWVRATPQRSETFVAAFEEPVLPVLGGAAVTEGDGSVVFVGGSGPLAQRYDVQKEAFELAGASLGVGLLSQSTVLSDGRVLFTGGLGLDGQPTDQASIYDPATGTTTTLSMTEPRAAHGAALLGDGRVLVTGGIPSIDLTDPLGTLGSISGTTEFFDPATDTFSVGPALIEPRALHTATALTTGDVLIAGGFTLIPVVNVPTVSPTAYRYSQTTGSFGLPALMQGARAGHSAVALPGGRALLVGGLSIDFSTFLMTGNIQDLVIGTRDDGQVFRSGAFGLGFFDPVPGLSEGRAGAGLALLDSGEVLVAGGFRLSIDLSGAGIDVGLSDSADLFAAAPNRFTPTGSMEVARLFPVMTTLADGTVLVVGGGVGPTEVYQR